MGVGSLSIELIHNKPIQPRVCGDYQLKMLSMIQISDTTPRVRGLLMDNAFLESLKMIQPRVCGDYGETVDKTKNIIDTTPRVRGLHVGRHLQAALPRYNPACAGTTLEVDVLESFKEIQPRVCGDYSFRGLYTAVDYDTTPRVRGLPELRISFSFRGRYNPACAGTT